MEATRPVSAAYSAPASLSWVLEAPAKFAAVKMLELPVLTGSLVARPNVMRGITVEETVCCQELTAVKEPPTANWCEPWAIYTLSAMSFTGELRRDELFVVVTPESPKPNVGT